MIIRSSAYPWVDVERFQEALTRVARGVVRVSADRVFSTGWCITDDLVVTTGYSIKSNADRVEIDALDTAVTRAATVVARAGGSSPSGAIAVLRMEQPIESAVAFLSLDAPRTETVVWCAHCARGERRPVVSWGAIAALEDGELLHDADTEQGSGGGPILDIIGRIVGVHYRSAPGRGRPLNAAHTIATVLDWLRQTPVWEEIADRHRLARAPSPPKVVAEAPADLLTRLAVRWRFAPDSLDEKQRRAVQPLVVDPTSPAWSLSASQRIKSLAAAGSLAALRSARGAEAIDEPGQRVIDRILLGPPFDLAREPFALLPYWLQAVRWFKDVVPDLPKPMEVQRALERRRVRARLRALVADGFRGRRDELARMKTWYEQPSAGPLAIHGIGGVGKSALVARFALSLPGDTLILWMDFDRADLSPDDQGSILAAIAEACAAQLDGFTWDMAGEAPPAERLALALAAARGAGPPPLVVLDSFEIAQHIERYQELWPVMERLISAVPDLRVIVTGRAPVPGLVLAGRSADAFELGSLAVEDADAFLTDHEITDIGVRATVLKLARGVPLRLQLAVRFIGLGLDVASVPSSLTEKLVEGYFYDRILDRVVDAQLKPLARGVLVLRRVTEEALGAIFADLLPAGVSPADAFARLRRELSLVEGNAELFVRRDVRGATLRLLEHDDRAFVRRVDQAAADWYTVQRPDDATLAELVYHRLRLGDVEGAAAVYREACAVFLRDANDDLDGEAATWLSVRLGVGVVGADELDIWEQQALARVRDLLSRGTTRGMDHILAERSARTKTSPLRFYDAWLLAGPERSNVPGALAALGEEREPTDVFLWNEAILRAWLIAKDDPSGADAILDRAVAAGRRDPTVAGLRALLGAEAARLHLTFAVGAERDLLRALGENGAPGAERILAIEHVLDPDLSLWFLGAATGFEAMASSTPVDFARAAEREHLLRAGPIGSPDPLARAVLSRVVAASLRSPRRLRRADLEAALEPDERALFADLPLAAVDLALAAAHRWTLLCTTSIAARMDDVVSRRPFWDPLDAALAFTLTALHPISGWRFEPTLRLRAVEAVLIDHLRRLAAAPFASGLVARQGPHASARRLDVDVLLRAGSHQVDALLETLHHTSERRALFLTVLEVLPDPLALLVEHLAGLPTNPS